jgi:hypothetical protein
MRQVTPHPPFGHLLPQGEKAETATAVPTRDTPSAEPPQSAATRGAIQVGMA